MNLDLLFNIDEQLVGIRISNVEKKWRNNVEDIQRGGEFRNEKNGERLIRERKKIESIHLRLVVAFFTLHEIQSPDVGPLTRDSVSKKFWLVQPTIGPTKILGY